MSGGILKHSALDLSVREHIESFIQPKMFKKYLSEVDGPTVSNIEGNDTSQALFRLRKAWWQDKDVAHAPDVWAAKVLGLL